MSKLYGKVTLITGGTSGIGYATALLFHEEGAKVFVTGRNEKNLEEARKNLPPEITVLQSDAGSLQDIDKLLGEVRKVSDHIDVLFLNAGVAAMKPFEATSEEDFDSMLDINLKGPFFTIQKALPMLGKGASVILTSSIAAHKGFAMMAAYSASKAAVKSLGATLGAYLAERCIRVNTISPGAIMTPIYGKAGLNKESLDSMAESFTKIIPQHRFGEPEEIAQAALHLASHDSSYLNATDIVVDGGYLAA